jgi:hypothetical protein
MKKIEMNQMENLKGGTCLSSFLLACGAWQTWASAQTSANAYLAAAGYAAAMYECGY